VSSWWSIATWANGRHSIGSLTDLNNYINQMQKFTKRLMDDCATQYRRSPGIGPPAWGRMLLPFVNNSRPLQWRSDLQIPVYFQYWLWIFERNLAYGLLLIGRIKLILH